MEPRRTYAWETIPYEPLRRDPIAKKGKKKVPRPRRLPCVSDECEIPNLPSRINRKIGHIPLRWEEKYNRYGKTPALTAIPEIIEIPDETDVVEIEEDPQDIVFENNIPLSTQYKNKNIENTSKKLKKSTMPSSAARKEALYQRRAEADVEKFARLIDIDRKSNNPKKKALTKKYNWCNQFAAAIKDALRRGVKSEEEIKKMRKAKLVYVGMPVKQPRVKKTKKARTPKGPRQKKVLNDEEKQAKRDAAKEKRENRKKDRRQKISGIAATLAGNRNQRRQAMRERAALRRNTATGLRRLANTMRGNAQARLAQEALAARAQNLVVA